MTSGLTVAAIGENLETIMVPITANPIPSNPPNEVKVIDSIRNCNSIFPLVAPIAFLSPISLVLSVTETSIIFMTPIPPTNREIPAILPINSVINRNNSI